MNACGKFPSWRPVLRVVLLREETDVVPQREQPLEQLLRLLAAPLEREHLDEPERAGEEDAFARRQPVDVPVLLRPVSEHESVVRELAPDRLHGGHDPRVVDAARNPTSGIMSALASSSSEPNYWTNDCRRSLQPRASTSAWISSRIARHRSIGAVPPELLALAHRRGRTRPRP